MAKQIITIEVEFYPKLAGTCRAPTGWIAWAIGRVAESWVKRVTVLSSSPVRWELDEDEDELRKNGNLAAAWDEELSNPKAHENGFRVPRG